MIPAQFDYVRPAAMHEALQILVDREGEAKILSGGYSLLPLLKLRLASPALLVDIRDLDGLDEIVETTDGLRIGGSRHPSPDPREPGRRRGLSVADRRRRRDRRSAGPQLGHDRWLVRPRRPVVGLAGRAASRRTPRSSCGARRARGPSRPADFFVDTFQTAIEPTELLTEV